jgi:hypothetical protein
MCDGGETLISWQPFLTIEVIIFYANFSVFVSNSSSSKQQSFHEMHKFNLSLSLSFSLLENLSQIVSLFVFPVP